MFAYLSIPKFYSTDARNGRWEYLYTNFQTATLIHEELCSFWLTSVFHDFVYLKFANGIIIIIF